VATEVETSNVTAEATPTETADDTPTDSETAAPASLFGVSDIEKEWNAGVAKSKQLVNEAKSELSLLDT